MSEAIQFWGWVGVYLGLFLLAILALIIVLFGDVEWCPDTEGVELDEGDLQELARIAREIDAGEVDEAKHRLERFLDELVPDWRVI